PILWRERIPAIAIVVLIIAFGLEPSWMLRWSEQTSVALGTPFLHSTTALVTNSVTPLPLPPLP
ncbi:MAG: NAD(P)H-quinone oxidoreductase subunit D4, partial [Cyanobacteria bacterium J06638_22]